MQSINSKFLLLLFFSVSIGFFEVSAQTIRHQDVSNLLTPKENAFRSDEILEEGVLLDLDEQFLSRVYEENNFAISIQLPISDEQNIRLILEQQNIFAKAFILRTSDGDTINYKRGLYYRGTIEGMDGLATISIFENELSGVISIKNIGDFNLGRIEGQRNSDYIIFNDRDIKIERNFECHTPDPEKVEFEQITEYDPNERYTECVKIYIEGDYALNLNKGGVTPATNYVTALFAEVAALYDAEEIGIEISEIMIWTSADGYDTNDSGTALDQFEANNPTFNGDLAHLFALGGNGIGGLAWVDVLCGWSPYAYENIGSGFQNYPNYSWTVEVVAHEMGHNFGSSHTHACVWNGNNTQIDDCGGEAGYPEGGCYDANDPILPASGTVMSYCHLVGGVGINLANGFGTQPGNLIRNKYNSAGCLTACNGPVPDPPVAEFDADDTDICEGDFVQYYDLSSNNPTEWEWTFEGGDPDVSFDQEPFVYYDFPGVFDVTLYVSNLGGNDELYFPEYLTVHAAPTAEFTYTLSNNNEVQFSNLSENAEFYLWDFGDGFTSTEENPQHTYNIDGTYDISLFSGNEYCSDDIFEMSVTIVTQPTAGMTIPVSEGCDPLTINFQDNSSVNVTNWLWVFEGGTPDTSYAEDPVVTYDTSGVYSVSLTVSNSLFSDLITYTDTIVVNDVPIAGFTPMINGNTVNFTNTSVEADTFTWHFGDGTTSTDVNPMHNYANGGAYNVELIAGNECGYDTTSLEIQITLQPVAAFQVLNSQVCLNDTAFFTSTSNTSQIEWIFEGGTPSTSTLLNPAIVYSAAGSYDVTMYAYNALGGDTLILADFITVLPDPTGNFSASISGYTANFDQNLNNANTFLWNFGDGNTSTANDPQHVYAVDGEYDVSLTVYGSCDTIILNETITIANPPVAAFSMDVTSGCASLTVNYTNNSSSNADDFIWTFEGGNPSSSEEMNPTVVYDTPGTFAVMLQAINEQGQDVMFQDDIVVVNGIPNVNFSYNSSVLTFNFIYPGNAGDEVTWDFGDGNISTELNPTHTYASEGSYTVSLVASNDCGNNQGSQVIEATIKPEAAFAFDTEGGCAPVVVNYTNQSTGNYSAILWLFDGGTPSTSTSDEPEVTYYVGGEFSTHLIAFSANGNDTLTLNEIISVDDGPDAGFYFIVNGPEVSFINTSEGADSYIWNFGDGNASTEENPVHKYTDNGTYTVTLYASNECGQKTAEITFDLSTVSVKNIELGSVTLFPNPNDGVFEVEFLIESHEELQLNIYDLLGTKVAGRSVNVTSQDHKERFELHDLKSGMYIMQITLGEKQRRIKFAIQ